jgi:hypothetical protein
MSGRLGARRSARRCQNHSLWTIQLAWTAAAAKRQQGLAWLEEVKASDSRFLEVEVARFRAGNRAELSTIL